MSSSSSSLQQQSKPGPSTMNNNNKQFYCDKCKQTFNEEMENGERETFAQHRSSNHFSCKCKNKTKYTLKRKNEHLDKFHPFVCYICPNSRFTECPNLQRHVKAMHSMQLKCILCGVDENHRPIACFNSKHVLLEHVKNRHPNERVFCCPNPLCSEVCATHDELMKHCLLQHEHRCIHCKLSSGGPNAQYPKFKSINKLRQHISVHHSENPCFFCGRLFMTTQELYTHQKEHCPTTYKCGVCDTQFATMSAKNNHQAQHISALGTCSTSSHPSQVQHNHTWHELNYRLRPWDRDARKLVGMGVLQTKITNLYNLKKGKQQQQQQQQEQSLPFQDNELCNQSEKSILDQYSKRIKDVYSENLHEFVTRTWKSIDGRIEKITCNLLENKPFLDQVDIHVMTIFDVVRDQLPYKFGLSFGFLLYNQDKDELRHFFIDEHLKRNPTNRNIIQQFPNIWTIRNDRDRIDRFGACAVSKNVDSPSTAVDRFDRWRSSNELNFSIDR